MRFYEYVHRDSFVHKLYPRAKLIWLICFSCLVFLTSNPYYYNSNLDFYFTDKVPRKLPTFSRVDELG